MDHETPELPSGVPEANKVEPSSTLAPQNNAEAAWKTNVADLVDLAAMDSDNETPGASRGFTFNAGYVEESSSKNLHNRYRSRKIRLPSSIFSIST